MRKYYKINNNKIKTIPFWIDTERFHPNDNLRTLGRNKLNLPENSFVYLVVSRIQKTKGIDFTLRAFSQILESNPNLYLVIAGGGDSQLLDHYRIWASSLNIASNTIFTDMVLEDDLPSFYNAADAFIMPSLLTEVLPYTILEAMATGLPVIATKRPGNYDALGPSGIYVNIGDSKDLASAMEKTYKDSTFRNACSEQNYDRFLTRFTMQNLIYKWLDFLNHIAENF